MVGSPAGGHGSGHLHPWLAESWHVRQVTLAHSQTRDQGALCCNPSGVAQPLGIGVAGHGKEKPTPLLREHANVGSGVRVQRHV